MKISICIQIKPVCFCIWNYLIKAGEILATISWRQVLAFCFTLLTLLFFLPGWLAAASRSAATISIAFSTLQTPQVLHHIWYKHSHSWMQHLSSEKFHFSLANGTLPCWRCIKDGAFWQLSGVTLALTFCYWARCPQCFWWTCPCWHLSPLQRAHNSACGPATPSVCIITKTWRTTLKHLNIRI